MSTVNTYEDTFFPDGIKRTTKLFERYGDFIHLVIQLNVKDEALREDIFQDLFLYFIFKPIPKNLQDVKAFLYRIISNRIKDAFRRVEAYQKRIRRYAHGLDLHDNDFPNPEKTMHEIEEMEKMFKAIERHLSRKTARALTLRYKNDYDISEVGEKMGIKSRSVSRYVCVGLKKMRGVIQEDGEREQL